MGKRRSGGRQRSMWVASSEVPRSAGNPFYERLNRVLDEAGFDAFAEERCAKFYADGVGRPSLAPGRYFRMLLLGYFEGLDSERAIAWRAADSLSLREFLDIALHEASPDHSTVSRTRRRIDLETHEAVFTWVLQRLTDSGLVKGKTIGIDATTLEANAAMRSIVRRNTGEGYETFLHRLAVASGIATPTRAELARLDRKRPKKGSNDDWTHPKDPDAKITKMNDGRTHLAHKAEHAVDLETGAVVGVTVQNAHAGDTTTMVETLVTAAEQVEAVLPAGGGIAEVVGDKGYHSNETMVALADLALRSYVSEPNRGRRCWKGKPLARAAVYGNRRRIRGARGKRLLRQRGERLERPNAHLYGVRLFFVGDRERSMGFCEQHGKTYLIRRRRGEEGGGGGSVTGGAIPSAYRWAWFRSYSLASWKSQYSSKSPLARSARSFNTASAPTSRQRAPVSSIRSRTRCRHAPSTTPVAIG